MIWLSSREEPHVEFAEVMAGLAPHKLELLLLLMLLLGHIADPGAADMEEERPKLPWRWH